MTMATMKWHGQFNTEQYRRITVPVGGEEQRRRTHDNFQRRIVTRDEYILYRSWKDR
jgi:hypothetical protein